MTRTPSLAGCLLVLLTLGVFGCGAGAGTTAGSKLAAGYPEFKQRLDAGAACAELYEIRNSLDPKSADIPRMNDALREIGCNSISSVRSTATPSAGSVKSGITEQTQPVGGFTVNEYRMYRALIDTPMSVPEQQALQNVSTRFGAPVEDVRRTVDKVQKALANNNWFGTRGAEIRHASDWKGETQ